MLHMDNHNNEIDELFRQRFDGLKDHSVDPKTQWSAVETQLNAGVTGATATTATSGGGFAFGSSVAGMAASVGSLIMVAGISSGDRSVTQESAVSQVIIQAPALNVETVQLNAAAYSTIPSDMGLADVASGDVSFDFASSELTSSNASSEATSTASLLAVSDNSNASDLAIASDDVSFEGQQSAWESVALVNQTEARRNLVPDFMNLLSVGPEANDIVSNNIPSSEHLPVSDWKKRHSFFLRAGLRIGSGESNSNITPALWSVNGVFTGGYRLTLDRKFFITAEAGWLRRSGNGVERSREVDPSIIQAVVNGYGSDGEELEVTVEERLIGYRMDYVHVPVALHMKVSKKSNGSVGVFGDYLVAALNDAHFLYNSRVYAPDWGVVSTTKEGLTKFRYGVLLGYDYDLHPRLTVAASGMVPLNSPMTKTDDFRMINNSNKLIDLQIGLKYNI